MEMTEKGIHELRDISRGIPNLNNLKNEKI